MEMYFIALLPPPEIDCKIKTIKLEMKERYHAGNALKLPAHITLKIPFRMPKEEESLLQDLLTGVAEETKSFELRLSGFGHFDSRVIFIKVEDHSPIIQLHYRITLAVQKIIRINEKGAGTVRRLHPHINIASRDLKKEDFPSAWKDVRRKEFSESFLVDHFCLFKHTGKSWDLQGQYFLQL